MDTSHSDGKNLASIFRFYETELADLKQELSILNLQNKEFKNIAKAVTDENKQLHAEIQELLEEQIKLTTGDESFLDARSLKNLQCQLKLVCDERDVAIKMNKENMRLLDSLQTDRVYRLHSKESNHYIANEAKLRIDNLEETNLQMQMLLESLQQENQTLSMTVSEQIKELKLTHQQSRDMKQKLIDFSRKQEDDKRAIGVLNAKLNDLRSTHAKVEEDNMKLSNNNQSIQSSLTVAEDKLAQALQAASESNSKVENLKLQLLALEKLNKDIEAKEMDYLMQIRQSAQLLDDALLARDSALSNMQKLQDDLAKSSGSLEILVQEVADRVKNEVDKVKRQYNANICKLTDDIDLLELENANLHSETDRAKRDKRAAEEELDMFRLQSSNSREGLLLEELQRRTIHAERARDDLLITVEKFEEKIRRIERESEEEKCQLTTNNENLENRINRLERENDENRHEKFQLIETVNQCKNENQKLEEQARSARLNAAKEFTKMKENLIKEKKQVEVKLSCLELNHQDKLRKLHKMLVDQQRVAARWKDEGKRVSDIYEDKVKGLQALLSRSQRRYQDLMSKLKSDEIVINDTSRLKEENRNLRSDLHQSHYETMSLAQKLSKAQSISNSITLHDLS